MKAPYLEVIPLTPAAQRYFRTRILSWYAANGRSFPWRSTAEPYPILLAEILLQRTQAPQVRHNYDRILSLFPTPEALASAPVDGIRDALHPLGLGKRAILLKRLGEELVARFNGQVRQDLDKLTSLPGVGRYAASATACFAFGRPVAIVDANVIRVFERFFNVSSQGKRPRDDLGLWEFAERLVPRRRAKTYNRALIDFASTVCKPRTPECITCPIRRRCAYAIAARAKEPAPSPAPRGV